VNRQASNHLWACIFPQFVDFEGMQTAKEISARFGQRTIAATLGVSVGAVSNAVVRGQFPASWYVAIQSLCNRDGELCPVEAFAFKPIHQCASSVESEAGDGACSAALINIVPASSGESQSKETFCQPNHDKSLRGAL
jgi:hypothetical protein